jgi:hypothetical protein
MSAEAGRKSHLKACQGIDHQPLGADLLHGVQNRLHGFIHRQKRLGKKSPWERKASLGG